MLAACVDPRGPTLARFAQEIDGHMSNMLTQHKSEIAKIFIYILAAFGKS